MTDGYTSMIERYFESTANVSSRENPLDNTTALCKEPRTDAMHIFRDPTPRAYSSTRVFHILQSESPTCSEGFEKCFLRVPHAVGLYCSCHAAQASKGIIQITYDKNLRKQVAAQDCMTLIRNL